MSTPPLNATRGPGGLEARGCLPRDTAFGSEHPAYEDKFSVYPRSDWGDLIKDNVSLRTIVQKIKDQGQEGSCTSNATAQAFEIAWIKTFGVKAWIEFSPISIYRWVGSSPSSGSTISGNLRQLKNVGLLPVSNAAGKASLKVMGLPESHTLNARGYYQSFPDNWKSTAGYFVGIEAFDIRSFDGMLSALFDDFPVVYGRSGHAICGVSPYQSGNSWGLDYANSWKPSWGDEGYGRGGEWFVSGAISSYGAWGLRAVRITDEALRLAA